MSHARATSPMAQSCTVSARGYDVQAYMHYFYYAPVTVPESWWEPCSSGRRRAARVAWPGISCGGTPPASSRRPPCRPAWWPVPQRDRPAVRPAAPCPAFARTRHRHSKPRQNIVYLSAELNRLCRIRVSADISIRGLSPVGGLIVPLYSVVAHRNATLWVQSI